MPKVTYCPRTLCPKRTFCLKILYPRWKFAQMLAGFSGLKSAICIFQQNLSKIMGFLINKKNSDGSEIENWPKLANFWPNLYAFCKLRHRWCLLNDNLSPWTKWLVGHVVILGIMSFGHFIALSILSYLGKMSFWLWTFYHTWAFCHTLDILSHNKILWFNLSDSLTMGAF